MMHTLLELAKPSTRVPAHLLDEFESLVVLDRMSRREYACPAHTFTVCTASSEECITDYNVECWLKLTSFRGVSSEDVSSASTPSTYSS